MSKTVLLYKCDECKKIIINPDDGLIIHGNIYVADAEKRGGLIGNNFPDPSEPNLPSVEYSVNESVYCVPCFLKIALPNTKLTATRG